MTGITNNNYYNEMRLCIVFYIILYSIPILASSDCVSHNFSLRKRDDEMTVECTLRVATVSFQRFRYYIAPVNSKRPSDNIKNPFHANSIYYTSILIVYTPYFHNIIIYRSHSHTAIIV